MKKKSKQSGAKGVIIGIILLCLVLGYYFYLSNNSKFAEKGDTSVKITAVQEVLMRNLDTNYPPSPREVLKVYGRITQCFYAEEYTDEEFEEMALQIQKLYDDELIANKTPQQYSGDLKWDVNMMKDQGIVISSYSPASSTDVEFFTKDGYKCAKIYCTFTLRKGTQVTMVNEVFILRKDNQGHWKIYGWKMVDEEGNTNG